MSHHKQEVLLIQNATRTERNLKFWTHFSFGKSAKVIHLLFIWKAAQENSAMQYARKIECNQNALFKCTRVSYERIKVFLYTTLLVSHIWRFKKSKSCPCIGGIWNLEHLLLASHKVILWQGKLSTHLPLETNGPDSIFFFCCVGLTKSHSQGVCYLPRIASTHLYTWVERSNHGQAPNSRTQHIGRNGARTYNLLFMDPALIHFSKHDNNGYYYCKSTYRSIQTCDGF